MTLLLAVKIISWLILITEFCAFTMRVKELESSMEVFFLMLIVVIFMLPSLYIIFGL